MIRVVHILWSSTFGGIERLVMDLASAQRASGHVKPSVLFGARGGEFFDLFSERGIDTKYLNLRSGRDFSRRKLAVASQIFRANDILHLHGFTPNIASKAAEGHAKIVYTEHGLFGYGRRKKVSDLVKMPLKSRFLARHCDYIAFNSRSTRALAEELYELSSVPRSVIYNGIAFDALDAEQPPVDEAFRELLDPAFVVGTACRFAGVKRLELLVEAFAAFQQNRQTVLLLVGDGPRRASLEALVRDRGIAERVIFAGYRENVASYLRAMDVCVLPSVEESFGLVALESYYLGKPVIVMKDGGGVAELVSGCSESDVVPNVAGIRKRLRHYYEAGTNEAGVEARHNYAATFDIQQTAARFEEIYKGLLS